MTLLTCTLRAKIRNRAEGLVFLRLRTATPVNNVKSFNALHRHLAELMRPVAETLRHDRTSSVFTVPFSRTAGTGSRAYPLICVILTI